MKSFSCFIYELKLKLPILKQLFQSPASQDTTHFWCISPAVFLAMIVAHRLQILDGLPWNIAPTFIVPRGWSLLTLVILWLFLLHHQQVDIFVSRWNLSPCPCHVFTVWIMWQQTFFSLFILHLLFCRSSASSIFSTWNLLNKNLTSSQLNFQHVKPIVTLVCKLNTVWPFSVVSDLSWLSNPPVPRPLRPLPCCFPQKYELLLLLHMWT